MYKNRENSLKITQNRPNIYINQQMQKLGKIPQKHDKIKMTIKRYQNINKKMCRC